MPKIFELCPIVLNDVQHIFPGGETFSRGDFAPPGYGPECETLLSHAKSL